MRGARLGLAVLVVSLSALGCRDAGSVLLPDLYKADTNWLIRETEHVRIKYRPNSPAARDLDAVAAELERSAMRVLTFLNVEYHNRVTFLVYSSKLDLSEHAYVSGDTTFSMPSAELALGFYDPPNDVALGPHEIAHVVVYWTVGKITSDLLSEGVPVAIENKYAGLAPDPYAADLLRQGRLQPPSVMFSEQGWPEMRHQDRDVYYYQAGSFVKFLVAARGPEPFKRFYTRASEAEYERAFREIYGEPIANAYADWLDMLRHLG